MLITIIVKIDDQFNLRYYYSNFNLGLHFLSDNHNSEQFIELKNISNLYKNIIKHQALTNIKL